MAAFIRGCGKAAIGHPIRDDVSRTEHCRVDRQRSALDYCFSYTMKDRQLPGNTQNKIIFAVKDCTTGILLPGEFQHPIFANSLSPDRLTEDHINRFGFLGPPPSPHGAKPTDDAWTIKDHDFVMDAKKKVIGPADGNLEICGRGGYCARHKLTDRNCCEFPPPPERSPPTTVWTQY